MGVLFIQPHRFGGFTPLSVAGCELLLDADDADSFTYSSGVSVSQWNDKSGNARHVTQATAANQPQRNGSQNGRTTVYFDGGDYLVNSSVPVDSPMTMFAVFSASPGVQYQFLTDGDDGTDRPIWYWDAGIAKYAMFIGGTQLNSSLGSGTSGYHQLSAVFNGSSSAAYWDGSSVASGTTGTGAGTGITVGARFSGTLGLVGHVAELIIYGSALGTSDRQAVEDYLAAKWGTP